jgi:hypothetical protein
MVGEAGVTEKRREYNSSPPRLTATMAAAGSTQ